MFVSRTRVQESSLEFLSYTLWPLNHLIEKGEHEVQEPLKLVPMSFGTLKNEELHISKHHVSMCKQIDRLFFNYSAMFHYHDQEFTSNNAWINMQPDATSRLIRKEY